MLQHFCYQINPFNFVDIFYKKHWTIKKNITVSKGRRRKLRKREQKEEEEEKAKKLETLWKHCECFNDSAFFWLGLVGNNFFSAINIPTIEVFKKIHNFNVIKKMMMKKGLNGTGRESEWVRKLSSNPSLVTFFVINLINDTNYNSIIEFCYNLFHSTQCPCLFDDDEEKRDPYWCLALTLSHLNTSIFRINFHTPMEY